MSVVWCFIIYILTHAEAQPRLNLSGPLVSSDALARPFPGCAGLTLHLLCQCVCMSLSPHTPWLTQTGLLPGPAAKIETHTHPVQSHTYAHTQGASSPSNSIINVCGTPVKPQEPQHFQSVYLPLPPSAAHCGVNYSGGQKKPSQLILLLLACVLLCVHRCVCVCHA